MPAQKPTKTSTYQSKEECYRVLEERSIEAMRCHKVDKQAQYQEIVDSLSRVCAALVIHHAQRPQVIVVHMESAMSHSHKENLDEINNKINRLFNKRRRTSINTLHGEQDLARITLEINQLEQCKKVNIAEIIHDVIYDSLAQACRNNGLEIPSDFPIRLYESPPSP